MSDSEDAQGTAHRGQDWRMPLVGAAAWIGGLLAATGSWVVLVGVVLVVPVAWVVAWVVVTRVLGSVAGPRLPRRGLALGLACAGVALAVGGAALVRSEQVGASPVADLAEKGAVVRVLLRVTGDPRPLEGPYADGVLLRAQVLEVEGRGTAWRLRAPVLVLADPDWAQARLGSEVVTGARLLPAEGEDLAAVLSAYGEWETVREPDVWWRVSARVRQALRDSVAHRPTPERILVPALVNGDDTGLEQQVRDDFATTGLTHLLAVSGTNLTLVVGLLVLLARTLGVRGRWLWLVGALGIVAFVLVARTEPSVLRAAAMGAVGLVALGPDGGRRAGRSLGVAVLVLLLLEPTLATGAGFALSVLATAGIVWLAPPWRDALRRWLPAGAAEAVAVPTAAQLACTPVVAAISGQVSLVAVGANLLAGPLVAPATVLGLVGGLATLVHPLLGRPFGAVATWCAAVVVEVAERGAALPVAAVDWGQGPVAVAVLTVATAGVAVLGPRVARRPRWAVPVVLVLVVATAVPLPAPGWPPQGWLVVACDVGQGDALVLRTGPGEAVVVDTGPEPALVDACLGDLGITHVPLVVLTHFHADHVGGLPGVLADRTVDEVLVTFLLDPPASVEAVDEAARAAGVPVSTAFPGTVRRIGDLDLQTLWPLLDTPAAGPGDGTGANDASVVLLAEVSGVRVLLTGDLEPPGQEALARAYPGLRVDVLKVPHHGSRAQDLDLLTGLGAAVALVSVGEGNDYGHPAPSVVEALEGAGSRVLRTDTDGALAVVADGSGLSTRARR
ncbi:ComEC/Rec2 family competence protein [Nocardioides bruguierae]|uniref:ComEC/Rec2 family competence protein n=1 Tax=Nocardioides bruguierae TaxID=2945102 RepID=A0A9X2IFI4_9ACTN|nr:ComEC/Rec2 family competence protein [Nocardioides bruguierae]MCM0621876.1 ComEC/Rec2 family competence protein [Nocardioides bruguierae]